MNINSTESTTKKTKKSSKTLTLIPLLSLQRNCVSRVRRPLFPPLLHRVVVVVCCSFRPWNAAKKHGLCDRCSLRGVRETSSRARNSKEKNQKEREIQTPACFALIAAVDVEHFGFCMYDHRIFFCVLSILLLASKLLARSLAPGRSSMEREKRE